MKLNNLEFVKKQKGNFKIKDLLKSKKSLFVIGIILFPIASVDLVLLVFAYRDFSLGLLAMSVVAIVIYPVSILLIYLNRPVYTSDEYQLKVSNSSE